MENIKIKKNANNIMWVEYWIQKAHPSFEDYELAAEKYDDYRWICEIELPLINKTVKSISEKEVNAMFNASEKAAKLIDEYMKNHPELKIINNFKGRRWEINGDENGKFLSMGMSKAWREEQGKQMMKMTSDSLETVKKAIKEIAKINGTSKNLFIQVLDQSLFDDDKTIEEIMHEVNDKIENDYYMSNMTVCYGKDGDSVIVVGYTFPKEEGGLN
jgi:hypothetical protein